MKVSPKSILAAVVATPLALVAELMRAASKRLRFAVFHQRHNALRALAERHTHAVGARPRVLAVVTHVAAPEEARSREAARSKVDKLARTLEGLLDSFAHCDLQIVVNSLSGRHVTPFLPDHLRPLVEVREVAGCEPMLVGFRAQDEFFLRLGEFDWFLFIEDDIILRDGCFLDKQEAFQAECGLPDAVLMPNRYEMCEGKKVYIDMADHVSGQLFPWNRLTAVLAGPWKFAECSNSHAAFYCLSQAQMRRWQASGREWYDKVTLVGPLESAVTGCLFECFSLYKPHPENARYLEVQHWDLKYAPMLQEAARRPQKVKVPDVG